MFDGLAVPFDFTLCPEDSRAAVPGLGKRRHGEACGLSPFEQHVHDLVVHDVVVAVVDAAAVRSGAECVFNGLLVYVVREDVHRPARLALRHPAQVDFFGGVRALCFDCAVQAPGCGTRWLVGRAEVFERAERMNGPARRIHDVADPVQVVAALGQKHRRRPVFPAPVTAHVRVRLVPVAGRLEPLDAHDVADGAARDQLFYLLCVRRVAQDVTHREENAGIGNRVDDRATVLRVGGDGFFEEVVNSEPDLLDPLYAMAVTDVQALVEQELANRGLESQNVRLMQLAPDAWRATVASERLLSSQVRLMLKDVGKYLLVRGYCLQVWCDDPALRREAALDQALTVIAHWRRPATQQAVDQLLETLATRLQTRKLDLAELLEWASTQEAGDVLTKLEELEAS